MNLSIINECMMNTQEDVFVANDNAYIKQQLILEYADNLNIFQEGFFKPSGSPELNVFKFKNKHIIKAIRHFNEAFKTIPISEAVKDKFKKTKETQERGKLDIKNDYVPAMAYDPDFIKAARNHFMNAQGPMEKGFQELQQQFDCKFKIYMSPSQGTGTIIAKLPTTDIGKLSISKEKGFQLGGLGISINMNVKQILGLIPSKTELFGQSLTAILLHEIYHNIVHMIDTRNTNLHNDIKKTVAGCANAKDRDSIAPKIKSFFDRFLKTFNVDKEKFNEQRAINRMYVLSKIQGNVGGMKKFQDDIKKGTDPTLNEKELDDYITTLQNVSAVLNVTKHSKMVATVCVILMAALGAAFGSTAVMVAGIVGIAIMALGMLIKKVMSLLGINVHVREEYFCDLFAAMYKLPVHLSSFNRQIKLNDINSNKVTKIRDIEHEMDKKTKDPHPLTFDREVTSYKVAKQLLDSKQKMKPEIRNYLQYIVDLHDGIDKINNPEDKRQKKKLDPEAAKDLQKVLDDFVKKTGAPVTESFVDDFIGGEYYGT